MAGTRFRMELDADEVTQAISLALARIEQPRDLYDSLGAALVASTDLRFENTEAPDKTQWPKSIRVLLEGGKTLTDTGYFRRTITHEASDTGVAVGTDHIAAAIHQFGGTIRAKNGKGLAFSIGGENVVVPSVYIPARPFLGLSDDDEAEIIALAGDWLLAPLGGADAPAANEEERSDG
jgi:phage virion morphogenesis protein